MIYRLSLIKYTKRYEITKATVKYKANRQYIFRWENRYDGSWVPLHNRFQRVLQKKGNRHKLIRSSTSRNNEKE